MGARNPFLASMVVLKSVLLPRLDATDLLRLGLSCRAMLAWVLSTPPALWQVGLLRLHSNGSCVPAST